MGKKLQLEKILALGGKNKYIIAIILLGLLLVAIPGGADKNQSAEQRINIEFSLEDFERQIEKALTSSLGVGRAEVILSLDSSAESVWAKEARQSRKEQDGGEVRENDSDTKPSIMSEGSGKETPILIKEIYPEFRGAVIICDGADDISVRADVIASVSALTGLTSDKISVIKMKI